MLRRFNKRAEALANYALDSGELYEWQADALKELLMLVSAPEAAPLYVQGRFDGAFRRTSNRSAIGVSLELVSAAYPTGLALLVLAHEIVCSDSYEAESFAAEALARECVQLYTKIFLASSA